MCGCVGPRTLRALAWTSSSSVSAFGISFNVAAMLASGVAVARFTSNASRRVVGQWGGAGGAIYEDHFALAGSVRVAAACLAPNARVRVS